MDTRSRPLVAVLVLLLAAGCVSTQKRYDKAEDLAAQGRHAEAAEYYIKVLEKEPDWPEARERLREVGGQAVDAYLDEAEAAGEEGRYEDALGRLDRVDALLAEAASVEVTLAVPEDYASFRAALKQDAVDALRREAEQAERRGDWDAARGAYERAASYTDDPGQQAALVREQARVYLLWADREADAGRYRVAFDRAQEALALVEPDDPLAERAQDLQAEALAAGTRSVAFLPFWQTEAVDREAPPMLVRDLNDVLLYEYWTDPVAFVAAADPVQVRRELRRLRYDRTVITRRQAAEIGRAVEADYVVVGEWTDFRTREHDVKEKTRKARLKGRAPTTGGRRDTTYVEQRLKLDVEAVVAYRLIDPHTRRVLDEGTVDAETSGQLTRAVYAGDYRDLDLSGSERSLFEDAERLVMEDLTEELVDVLAVRLADRVYDRLLRQIP